MPHEADGERALRQLNRLDQIVRHRPARGDEPIAQPIQPLVVVRADLRPLGARGPRG